MDALYLQENVGIPLSKALAACTIARAEDPIEYVAAWLIQYVQNAKREEQVIFLYRLPDLLG